MAKTNPNRLRVWRAERRMTQLTLARKSRINVARVSFIENGLAEPTDRERRRLARVLKVMEAEAFPVLDVQADSIAS